MHDYTYERPVKIKVPWFGKTFLSKQCFDIGILRHFNTFILYKYLIIITQERIFDGMLSSNVRGSNSWYFPNCTSFYKRLITSSHGLLQTWFSCFVVFRRYFIPVFVFLPRLEDTTVYLCIMHELDVLIVWNYLRIGQCVTSYLVKWFKSLRYIRIFRFIIRLYNVLSENRNQYRIEVESGL